MTSEDANARSSRPIQALIITGQICKEHDYRASTAALRRILEDTGGFEVRVTEEFRDAGPGTLEPYDVVILNYYGRPDYRDPLPELRWGRRAELALFDFVRSGKGVVAYHASLIAGYGWGDEHEREYERMCGGNMRPGMSRRAPSTDFTVNVVDREHPITQGVSESFRQTGDDFYCNLKWQPDGTYHVLATVWDDPTQYEPDRNPYIARVGDQGQPLAGVGEHHPVVWTLKYGDGRVFSIAIGHMPPQMGPDFATLFTRGAEWAATGAVTLPVPATIQQQSRPSG